MRLGDFDGEISVVVMLVPAAEMFVVSSEAAELREPIAMVATVRAMIDFLNIFFFLGLVCLFAFVLRRR